VKLYNSKCEMKEVAARDRKKLCSGVLKRGDRFFVALKSNAFALQVLSNRLVNALQSLHYRAAGALQSRCDRFGIALQSLCNRSRIAL
jgi:hypothetical protein